MTNRVIGPGIGLPSPQALYVPSLAGAPFTPPTAEVALPNGASIQIPAGDWFIDPGKYSVIEIQDPVRSGVNITQTAGFWRPIRPSRGPMQVHSDGVNFRITNPTGTTVGATITNAGSNYVQATTVVTPSTGTSTWQAIVGGAIAHLSCSIVGASYGRAPLVVIPQPPAPGIQATAIATISVAGAINGFTMINQGAGYTSIPPITILPDPYDTATSITAAAAFADLTGSGAVTGIILTNTGAPVATSMTLAVTGVGTSALITATFCTTITGVTMTALGTGSITGAGLITTGGIPPAVAVWTEVGGFIPRQANVQLNVTAGAVTGAVIIDPGFALGTFQPLIATYGGTTSATGIAPTVIITQGGATDSILMQPL